MILVNIVKRGPCIWKGLVYRIVVGVWCLAAFVLLQSYNSLLITYIITPNNPPLPPLYFFPQASEYALDTIIEEYKNFGRCNLQLAKEGFLRFSTGWMFPKRTPYRNSFAIAG